MSTIDEGLTWLDTKQFTNKSEIDDKQKEIEGILMPFMTKLYQGHGQGQGQDQEGGGFPSGMPDVPDFNENSTDSKGGETADEGPKIDEID